MICVYVVSFMTTVTAFASFDVKNSRYIGKYIDEAGIIPGYILVDDVDECVKLFAYEDDNYLCFVTGSSETAILGKYLTTPFTFYSYYIKVKRVTLDGSPAYGDGYINGYYATGDLKTTLFKEKIISNESAHTYIK